MSETVEVPIHQDIEVKVIKGGCGVPLSTRTDKFLEFLFSAVEGDVIDRIAAEMAEHISRADQLEVRNALSEAMKDAHDRLCVCPVCQTREKQPGAKVCSRCKIDIYGIVDQVRGRDSAFVEEVINRLRPYVRKEP